MSKTFRFSKKYIFPLLVVVLLLVAAIAVLYILKIWEDRPTEDGPSTALTSQNERAEIFVGGEKYVLKENVDAVLFIGVDTYEKDASQTYINGQQADVLMLLVMDHDTQRYTVMQLNRDTMTQIQTLGVTGENGGTITAQLALAHAYGTGANDSSRNTVKAVSNLLYGVEIAHFATIRMDAIPILNDAVGGVEVELLDDFTMLDERYEKGAAVTLHGDDATAYVQYRGQLEDSSNISRMARQRQYITSWSKQLEAAIAADDNFVASTVADIADDLISDMTVQQMSKLADDVASYTSEGIVQVAGESVKGEEFMEFYVDEAALQKQVLQFFYTLVK